MYFKIFEFVEMYAIKLEFSDALIDAAKVIVGAIPTGLVGGRALCNIIRLG